MKITHLKVLVFATVFSVLFWVGVRPAEAARSCDEFGLLSDRACGGKGLSDGDSCTDPAVSGAGTCVFSQGMVFTGCECKPTSAPAARSCDEFGLLSDRACGGKGLSDGDSCTDPAVSGAGTCVFSQGMVFTGCECKPTSANTAPPDNKPPADVTPPINPDNNPNIAAPMLNATLNELNPLRFENSPYLAQFSTPAGILSRALIFGFAAAGLILFIMILYGGFTILKGAQDDKSLQEGKQRITAALVGFLLLFSSYWIMQVIQIALGIRVLQ